MNSHCLMECARLVISLPFQYDMQLSNLNIQDYFSEFGDFLDRKISEFEGQFWNDPDWFFGGVWPEQGFDAE